MKKILRDIILISIFFSIFGWNRTYIQENLSEVERYAEETGIDNSLPLKDFKTDGCTFWPDSFFSYSFQEPCIKHDIRYWAGGTEEDRLKADLKLKDDVNKILPGIGDIIYIGVRLGGKNLSSLIPWPWGWGYGWDRYHLESQILSDN